MKDFLFDTADVDALKRVWSDLKGSVIPDFVAGITTNPAIFQRAGKNSLGEWFATFIRLSDALNEIKGHTKGELHIQFPNSQATVEEVENFVDCLLDLRLPNKLFVKLPPYSSLLEEIFDSGLYLDVGFNVTGLAEAGTILKLPRCLDYASIIPGRMLQAGLDYREHVAFAVQNSESTIITGALRDYQQVADCFQLRSLPTIGLKTWDLIIQNKELDKLLGLEYSEIVAPEFMPPCDERHTVLSISFFKEMDGYGAQAYEDFKKL